MPTLRAVYTVALTLLGAWGLFTTRPLWSARGHWTGRHWHLLLAEATLVVGSWLSAAALSVDRFSGPMLLPVGVSYALMMPLPCYFELVNRIRWIHVLRNALFAVVAAVCLGVGVGLISLSMLGLA